MHSYYHQKAASKVVYLTLKFSGHYQDWMIALKSATFFFIIIIIIILLLYLESF